MASSERQQQQQQLPSDAIRRQAQHGHVVSIELSLEPENGFVPEPLFDSSGPIAFVLGWGNYLPGLHELVTGCSLGNRVENVCIDAGWGTRKSELVVRVRKEKLSEYPWQLHRSFFLKGMQVWVTEDHGNEVTLDANHPLAGASYLCTFTVLAIEEAPSLHPCSSQKYAPEIKYRLASFALGCFWGAELAFLRREGVIGTRVGYSHGMTINPSYEQVCEGHTQHREAVLVLYDPDVVNYRELISLALERLSITTASPIELSGLSLLFEENIHDSSNQNQRRSMQYRHGFYYFHADQKQQASEELGKGNFHRFGIEVLPADIFYEAEEHHQKYLYKRGQSAKKGCKEIIRCYG